MFPGIPNSSHPLALGVEQNEVMVSVSSTGDTSAWAPSLAVGIAVGCALGLVQGWHEASAGLGCRDGVNASTGHS